MKDKTRALLEGPNYATLTTLFADGSPQTQVMWVHTDGEHVIINTEIHRAKYKNMVRDPRVVVTVWEAGNPVVYAEIRGRMVSEVRGPEAPAHLDELAQKYTGKDWAVAPVSERVIVKILPEREVFH